MPGYNPSPETRKKISESMKGKKKSSEHKEKIRQKALGRVHSEETKRKIASYISKETSLERDVKSILNKLGLKFKEQVYLPGTKVDFLVNNKIVIYADGCYWHGCIDCGHNKPWHLERRKRDYLQQKTLEENE